MKKYGVIMKNEDGIRVLQTCYSKEAVIIAVQLQKNIYPRAASQITGVLGEFDGDDNIIEDRFRYLCA